MRGHPYILFVDPINVCNLKCPLCPTATGELGRRPSILKYEAFTQIIDRFAPYAYEVNLYNWGEPLLNPDIFRMIEYVHTKNLMPSISTNLNTVRDDDIEKLSLSNLEYLTVSLDGTTEEVYSYYRRGGRVQLVMANLCRLLENRRLLNRRTPFIEWQYIVMKHNTHQIDEARRVAKEIGVDLLRFIPVGLPFDFKNKAQLRKDWYPDFGDSPKDRDAFQNQAFQKPKETACFYLYRSITFNADGGVAPCCIPYSKGDDFGDLSACNLDALWNNRHYKSARALFSKRGNPTLRVVCHRCSIFKHRAESAKRPDAYIQDDL